LTPKRLFKNFLFVIAAIVLITGCSSNKTNSSEQKNTQSNSSTPQTGGKITVGVSGEPDTLDPQKTSMDIADQILGGIGGSLLTVDPDTNEVKPYLAESYKVSEDGKTFTFKIRSGVKFQDGTPLTAKIFKDTYDRILDPKTGATVAANFFAGVKSLTAPDDSTLVIELGAPNATFLYNMAMQGYLQPLSPAALTKGGADYGRNPVGVGPWKFKEWVTGQSVTLVRNDDFNWPQPFYKNKGKTYLDQLQYKFIKDPQTMLAALDSGSVDVVLGAAPKDAQRYRKNSKFQVDSRDKQGLGLFMEMNLDNDILKDINVRKALNMAINKDAMIKTVLNGEGSPAYGPLPSTIFGYDPKVKDYGYKYNKKEAIKLLEESGWKKNSKGIMEKDGKELSFELLSYDRFNQQAQVVQAMLKDIGVNISIQTMEPGTLIEKVSKGSYQLSFLGYTYYDPDILYLLFHSSQIGGLNHVRVNNPELDSLLEKGRTEMDSNERKKIYAQVQKIVVEQAYWAPIYVDKQFTIVNKRVQNLKFSNFYGLLFNDSWVKK
jgi:peptide/nickel transport system substrate-binding protein